MVVKPALRAAATLSRTAAASMVVVDPVLTKDYGQAAAVFFSNMRVPAALIAAAAIKDAFALETPPADVGKSPSWTMLRNAYLLLQMVAFTSELSVVVFSTSAIGKLTLMATTMDMRAPSLTALLNRDLAYEYVGVQCDFLSGILCFILASALRVRFALRKDPVFSHLAMWLVIYRATILLTYSNAYMMVDGGFTEMLRRRATAQLLLLGHKIRAGPGASLSVFALLYAGYALLRIIAVPIAEVQSNNGGEPFPSWVLRQCRTLPQRLLRRLAAFQ